MKLVSSIDVPTLLVTTENVVVSSEVAAKSQYANPKLRVEKLPKAGHGLHYEQPERFAAVVKSFLRSIDTMNQVMNCLIMHKIPSDEEIHR